MIFFDFRKIFVSFLLSARRKKSALSREYEIFSVFHLPLDTPQCILKGYLISKPAFQAHKMEGAAEEKWRTILWK